MAQVPYSPIPDVPMQDISAPKISVSGGAIEGASGENIGRAIGHFGAVLAHSGDELFRTAMMLQEQKNQAEANEAETKYSLGLTDLHTKFASQEGRTPSDTLMDYTGSVDKLRKQIREGLSSDAVRRMYDRNSLQSMQIAIRNGASHAASQLKQYGKTEAASSVNLLIQRAYENPNDPLDYILNSIEEKVRNSARAEGLPEEKIVETIKKAQSDAITGRIEGMNKEKPAQAQELLDAAVSKGQLWGDSAIKLQEKITSQLIHVEARNIAATVLSDPTVSEKDAVANAEEMAGERSKDPRVRDAAVQQTMAEFGRRERIKNDTTRRAMETVNEAIMSDKVVTVDDLLRMPGVEAAIKDLPASKRKELQGAINRYNQARDKPVNDAEMERIIGLRQNPATKKEFMELDPTKLPLSTSQMKQVAAWQKTDGREVKDNPHVRQSIQWIRESMGAELRSLGLFSREKKNEDAYDRFEGMMYVFLDTYKQRTGKYPDQQTVVNDIAPLMIKRAMGLYKWGGYGPEVKSPTEGYGVKPGVKGKAMVEQEPPKEWADKFSADALREHGVVLSPMEIGRGYMRFLLMEAEKAGKISIGKGDVR